MGSPVNLTISAAVAACTRAGSPKELKLDAVHGALPLSSGDRVMALIILSQDSDAEVKAAAIRELRGMPESMIVEIAATPDIHPRVLDILARLHYQKPAVVAALTARPDLAEATATFFQEKGRQSVPSEAEEPAPEGSSEDDLPEDEEEKEPEPIKEESEEFKSKYQLYQSMGVGEKIKAALTGDKEWRMLLIKDSNKLVSSAVVKNPRITEAEILAIAKSVIQNEDILRVICTNKEWLKHYQIRKALSLNNKTPLPNALKYIATLTEKDLAGLARSKNVSTVIANQARRLLTSKKKK